MYYLNALLYNIINKLINLINLIKLINALFQNNLNFSSLGELDRVIR
jgi:hypothetical protein